MRQSTKNEALLKLARDLYEELGSGNAVARRLHLSHTATYRLLHDAGVVLPDRHGPEVQEKKKKLHGALAEAAVADYVSGMPMAAMRAKYHVGRYAIVTAVQDAGFPVRDRGQQPRQFTDEQKREMVDLYQTGLSQAHIAVKFHTSAPTVSRIIRKSDTPVVMRSGRNGAGHGAWKGGRFVETQGYIRVWLEPDDPMASMRLHDGYVQEHRLVMARWLGRPLTPAETVHHRDGQRSNNDIQNLQIRFGNHGKGSSWRCRKCGSTDLEPCDI